MKIADPKMHTNKYTIYFYMREFKSYQFLIYLPGCISHFQIKNYILGARWSDWVTGECNSTTKCGAYGKMNYTRNCTKSDTKETIDSKFCIGSAVGYDSCSYIPCFGKFPPHNFYL